MIVRRTRWRGALALAVTVVVPAVLAFVSGLAVLHTCVPAPGLWAQAGLRLALLHPDSACPQGALALGAAPGQALTVVVAVAVPAVVAHLALLGGAVGVVGSARRVTVATVRRVVHALAPASAPVVELGAARTVVPRPPTAPVRTVVARRPWRRGPPALLGTGA